MTDALATIPAAEPDVIALPTEIQTQLAKDREALRAQIGTVKLTADQRKQLLVHATIDQVELKPTGEIYMPGVFYRGVLHQVFGPGGWGVRNGAPHLDVQTETYKSTLYLQVMLVVGRCVRCMRSAMACECGQSIEQCGIAEDVGAQAYHPTNARLSYDDALTAAVTNGLMRCCSKTLGVYANCWEPRWADDARWQVGVQVRVTSWNNKETKPQWRRWDRRPVQGEIGLAPGSPNADKYESTKPTAKPVRAPDVVATVPKKQDFVESGDAFKQALVNALPKTAQAKPNKQGEQIGVIRKDASGPAAAWIVTTDVTTHWTDDPHVVRDLEALKGRGKRVVIEDEVVAGPKGDRKRIFNYKAI